MYRSGRPMCGAVACAHTGAKRQGPNYACSVEHEISQQLNLVTLAWLLKGPGDIFQVVKSCPIHVISWCYFEAAQYLSIFFKLTLKYSCWLCCCLCSVWLHNSVYFKRKGWFFWLKKTWKTAHSANLFFYSVLYVVLCWTYWNVCWFAILQSDGMFSADKSHTYYW